MKTSNAPQASTSSQEFAVLNPFLFGQSLNDVDVAFRGGVYAIRPSKSSVNPNTGFPTHGIYHLQQLEILDGDFAGETRTRSWYLGNMGGSIPKGTPPRMLMVPSVDGRVPVDGLTPDDIIALAIGTATFGEDEYSKYEGKHILLPKDRSNTTLQGDSQYGQLVNSIKRLYPVGKNPTPQEIAFGTTFPGILKGDTGPDFALNYGFHMKLEGDAFKCLVATAALGLIEPSKEQTVQVQTGTTQVVAETTNGSGFTIDTVRPLIYQALMQGPANKNELITKLMNSTAGNKDSLVGVLLTPGAFDSDLWAIGADGKYALK